MSSSPFNKVNQHALKRQAVLSEAASLFNRNGTRSTTLIDIADRLSLTKTSLYYYVKTKEELIYLCYSASCDFQDEITQHADAVGNTGREKLEAAVKEYFRRFKLTMQNKESEKAVLTEIRTLKGKHLKEITHRYRQCFLTYQRFFSEGVEDGSLETCNPVACAVSFFGNLQWTVVWLNPEQIDDIDTTANTFIDIYMNGLLAKNTPAITVNAPKLDARGIDSGFDRDTQNKIKQEAFHKMGSRFFNKKGYKGTSLDEIAEALHVTKGAFYYHIKNKDDLLYQCFSRSHLSMSTIQNTADHEGGNGLEKLMLSAYHLFHFQHSDNGPLIRYNLLNSLSPKRREKTIEETQETAHRFGGVIAEGIKDKSVRPVDALVVEQIIAGAINSCTELTGLTDMSDLEKASADFYQPLFSGLAKKV